MIQTRRETASAPSVLLSLQAAQNAVDEVREQLTTAQATFDELRASFMEDATALTGWMNALFAIADMGITTFTVGGETWPLCAAATAFSEKDGSEATDGVEKMLSAFQKRYARERGAGTTQACFLTLCARFVQCLRANLIGLVFVTHAGQVLASCNVLMLQYVVMPLALFHQHVPADVRWVHRSVPHVHSVHTGTGGSAHAHCR